LINNLHLFFSARKKKKKNFRDISKNIWSLSLSLTPFVFGNISSPPFSINCLCNLHPLARGHFRLVSTAVQRTRFQTNRRRLISIRMTVFLSARPLFSTSLSQISGILSFKRVGHHSQVKQNSHRLFLSYYQNQNHHQRSNELDISTRSLIKFNRHLRAHLRRFLALKSQQWIESHVNSHHQTIVHDSFFGSSANQI
jgi:hypothetical protein